ncbi:MAG: hypothetical protein K9M15_01180 [Candidatus Marinimicrobia bacterium]|nr:hypothetical protein [Candidatus Neomarinimicrobiota bacterium]
MKKTLVLASFLFFFFCLNNGLANDLSNTEASVSGVVTSIHLSPTELLSLVTVCFGDGRRMFFESSKFIGEIKINSFNTLYFKGKRITKVEQIEDIR